MKEKIIDGLFILLFAIGLLFIMGTVGASDCDFIGVDELAVRGAIGALVTLIGLIGLKKRGIV